jgi:hypothetical protein
LWHRATKRVCKVLFKLGNIDVTQTKMVFTARLLSE